MTKTLFYLFLIFSFGIGHNSAINESQTPEFSSVIDLEANTQSLRSYGYHEVDVLDIQSTITLNENSAVGVYIQNPGTETGTIQNIKAKIHTLKKGEKAKVKFHIYAFNPMTYQLGEDLLENDFVVSIDDKAEVKTFELKGKKVKFAQQGVLITAQLMEGDKAVSIPTGEKLDLEHNVNYTMPRPENIVRGANIANILQRQLFDKEHPLMIGVEVK